MSTDLASLSDGTTTVDFMMSPDWEPSIHEIGALYYPLGYEFAVKSTDTTKGISGQFTIVCTSQDMESDVETLLAETGELTLTLPDGSSYVITIDPATDRQGKKQFSLWNWQPILIWTVKYAQVG